MGRMEQTGHFNDFLLPLGKYVELDEGERS